MIIQNKKLLPAALAFVLATTGSATVATAGSLTDTLLAKGVITADEAKEASAEESKFKVAGQMFTGIRTNKTTTTNAAGVQNVSADTTGAFLDRAYLDVRYKMDSTWSARLTTDVVVDPVLVAGGSSRQTNVYLKHAFVEGKFAPELNMTLGVIGAPWVDYEQGLWKHRYASQVYVDKMGFDSSADAGLSFNGKLLDDMVGYAVAGLNGGGYGKIAATKTYDMDARLGFYPMEGLTVDLQYRDGYKGTKNWNQLGTAATGTTVAVPAQSTNPGTKSTLSQLMLTYGTKDWRIGGNYAVNKGTENLRIDKRRTTDTGYDLWAWMQMDQFGLFGRYETTKQTRSDLPAVNQQRNRLLVGAEYIASKKVRFSAVMDSDLTKNNGHIANAKQKVDAFGLYSEVNF